MPMEKGSPVSCSGNASEQRAGFQGQLKHTHRHGPQKGGDQTEEETWGRITRVKGVKYMVTEGD